MVAQNEFNQPAMGLSGKIEGIRELFFRVLQDQSEEGHAKRIGLTALAIRVIAAAIAYGSHVLLARFLGSFEYGIFAYVWVWATILGPTTSLGLSHATYRFVPHYRETGEHDMARGYIHGGTIFVLIMALTVSILGALGLYVFRDSIQSYYLVPFLIGAILLPLITIQDYVEGIARAYSWIATAIGPPFVLRQALIVIGVIAVILADLKADAITAVTIAVIATAISLIVHILILRHRLKKVLEKGDRRYAFAEWIKTSIHILAVDLSHVLFAYADIIVLSLYWPPDVIAVYFAATRILQLVHFVRYAATAATAQRFSANNANGNHAQLRSLAQVAVRWTFWVSFAGACCVAVAGQQLLGMFGSDFTAGYSALVLLASGVVIQSTAASGEDLLNMTGHERISAKISVVAVAVNFALNFALVPEHGVLGAAIATVLSMALRNLLLGIAARKHLGIEVFIWNLRRGDNPG